MFLSCITFVASQGLTTNELEDILSCDEDVLQDVFQYWTPPIRRLPPLLWVRIRADLASYLVDRGADGTQVTCWYHRQFVQAAVDRYLSDPFEKKNIHSAIADYFLGRNFVGKRTFADCFTLLPLLAKKSIIWHQSTENCWFVLLPGPTSVSPNPTPLKG